MRLLTIKSLMISSDFPPIPGGQSRFLFDMWSNLPPDKIIIISPKVEGCKEIDANLPFKVIRLSLPLQNGFLVKSLKTLLLLLHAAKIILFESAASGAKIKVDRIHCGQVLSGGFVGYICHLLFGIPYFPYVHGADFLEFKSKSLTKKLLNPILKNASLTIANSSFTKRALIDFGISEEKIKVINPPVDYKKFENIKDADALKEKYGLKGKKVLLTTGRLVERKGHDYVIKALPEVIKEISDIHYLIVGDGIYRNELEKLSEGLNVRDFITFAGFIPDDRLPDYYAMSDVFIMVSREIKEKGDVEGFGIVYLEANAVKKPVIAGMSGGIADAVEDGINGVLVNPTDTKEISNAIIKLMKDDKLRTNLGESGYKRVVEKFGPKKQAEILYKETFQPNPPTRPFLKGGKGRIKILHIITRQDKGGSAENTLLTVLGLNKENYDVTLVKGATLESVMSYEERSANEMDLKKASDCGVKIITISELVRRISPLNDLKAFIKLISIIKNGRYQIVHTHTSKAGILGRWAAWLCRTPIIVHTPHGHIFYGYYGRLKTGIFIIIERITAFITDRIITLTEREKQEHIAFKIASSQKFITIHSGVETKRFLEITPEDTKRIKKEFNIKEDCLVVGTVGRLVEVKGHKYLIQAAHKILKRIQNYRSIKFIIVGDGPLMADLKREANLLGISESVIFTGWRNDVPAVMSVFDIFVLPSLNEGMGKVLIEAMLLKKPIIASRAGGIPDLIKDGENGIIIKPSSPDELTDAIIALLKSEDKRKKMGDNGRIIAESYGDKAMVEKLEGVYEDII